MSDTLASPPAPLIRTKLHPPGARTTVPRARLFDALRDTDHRLILIRAPAGWGKSTLIAQWCADPAERRRFAWLSLDAEDDEPLRFWLYVIEALRTVAPSVGAESTPLLRAPGTSVTQHTLPALINELTETPAPSVLVVDDYHDVRNRQIHDQLTFLVDHLPPTLQVVLASRTEPPLPLPRLRAAGDLLELGVDALRFDPGETEKLLNGTLELGLGAGDVLRLHERTEGWGAGLQLAALSLRAAADPGSFIDRFAGDDRNVVDYLGSEVLAAQPPDLRRFLLETSILRRFNADLAAAVTGDPRAARMLRDVERSNAFLMPLDSRRAWYRYHHLFRQLLMLELVLSDPGAPAKLHRRAARWWRQGGAMSEAVEHTIAAGDTKTAGELIAEHWAATLLQAAGDRTVESWLRSLGDDAIRADVRLCVAFCWIGLSLGRMDVVETWLTAAESAPLVAPFRDGFSTVEGALACIRAGWLWESGDVGGALRSGREVLAQEPEGSPWRSTGAAVIGLARGALCEWAAARDLLLQYAEQGHRFGQHVIEVSGLGSAAAYEAERGAWEAAGELAERSLDVARRHGIHEHWVAAGAHLARGLFSEERGDLARASGEARRAVELSHRGAGPVTIATALMHLARIQGRARDRAAAEVSMASARHVVSLAPDPGRLPARLAELDARLAVSRPPPVAGAPLSAREHEVLRLLPTGLSQREIADQLYVSLNTVKTHTRSIFRKVGASSRSAAVERARGLGLL